MNSQSEIIRFHMISNEIIRNWGFFMVPLFWPFFANFEKFMVFNSVFKDSYEFIWIHTISYYIFCQASMKLYDFIRIHSISNDFDQIHMIFGISFLFLFWPHFSLISKRGKRILSKFYLFTTTKIIKLQACLKLDSVRTK